MFEHVGMIAGMKGMVVAEHGVALSWEKRHFIAGWFASATLAKYCRKKKVWQLATPKHTHIKRKMNPMLQETGVSLFQPTGFACQPGTKSFQLGGDYKDNGREKY